jgi:iron complex outermembrane recepter protein
MRKSSLTIAPSTPSRLAIVTALGCAMAWQAPAHAQDAAPAPANAPDASASQAIPGEIIVTAQRREQRLIDVPLSVQAKTGAALTKAGITDGRGLEQVSPALSFESGYSPQTTSLAIRGVVSIANEGGIQPSVGVVVDNMPLARQGEVTLDLADIERVEILSGPQGTLFGKNSTAGVVNIVTKKPTDHFDAGYELTGTSDKEAIAKAYLNVPLGSIFSARVNGYYRYLTPKVPNSAGPDEFGQRAYGIQGKLLMDLGRTTFLLTGSYNHEYDTLGALFVIKPLAGAVGALQQQVNPFIGFGETRIAQNTPSYNRAHEYSVIGELNSELSDRLKLTSITGYRSYRYIDEIDVDAGPTGGNVGSGLSPNPLGYPIGWYGYLDNHEGGTYRYFSQEARLAYSTSRVDAILGGYYQRYRETRFLRNPFLFDGSFAPGDPSLAGVQFFNLTALNSRIKDDTAAVFGDVTVTILPTLKVFGGLRYTHEKLGLRYHRDTFFNPVDGFFDPITGINSAPPIEQLDITMQEATSKHNNLSGRAGIQWQPSRNLNYYFSYSRGYKGPAANQGTGVVSAATSLLNPEIATAFELGAKQRLFDGKLDIDIALFKQKIKNIQQTSVRPGSVSIDLINAGALKTDGVEFNATGRPFPGLTLAAGVVYNHARYSGDVSFSCGPTAIGAGTCENSPGPGLQSLDGKRAIAVPKWKVVTSGDYSYDLPGPYKLDFTVAYNWRSSIQYQLFEDPLTLGEARGILDASVGIATDNDRWQLTVFVKNLTNKFYYNNLNTVTAIGLEYGNLPRDYARYGGIRLSYHL